VINPKHFPQFLFSRAIVPLLGHRLAGATYLLWKISELGKPITDRQDFLFVIEVHRWLEGHASQWNADVRQAEGGVIDHYVAAALGAIPAVAQLTGVEFTEKLLAFDFHGLGFPQCEDTDGRRAITPALVAMTVTHVDRLTGRFDFHRSAVTSACMPLRHAMAD